MLRNTVYSGTRVVAQTESIIIAPSALGKVGTTLSLASYRDFIVLEYGTGAPCSTQSAGIGRGGDPSQLNSLLVQWGVKLRLNPPPPGLL